MMGVFIMDNNDTRKAILDAYFKFTGLRDIDRMTAFIKRIKAHISINSVDTDLEFLIVALNANRENQFSGNTAKCIDIAMPIFEWLKNNENWDYWIIVVLCTTLHFAPTYKLAHQFAQKAIRILKRDYSHEDYRGVEMALSVNMTLRLQHAYLLEITDPARQKAELREVNELFTHYRRQSHILAKERNLPVLITVVDIRHDIITVNCNGIIDGLKKLKDVGAHDWLKTSHDEVREHFKYFGGKVTTKLINVLRGYIAQQLRIKAGMKTSELAEILDTSQQVVNSFENGDSGISKKRENLLAQIYGVDPSCFEITVNNINVKPNPPAPKLDPRLLELKQIARHATDDDWAYIIAQTKLYMRTAKRHRRSSNNNNSGKGSNDM